MNRRIASWADISACLRDCVVSAWKMRNFSMIRKMQKIMQILPWNVPGGEFAMFKMMITSQNGD